MPKYIAEMPLKTTEIIIQPRAYPKGFRLGTHVHSQAQLLYSASGLMNVATPKGIFLVPPQRACWIPPNIEHSVDVLADIDMKNIYLERSWVNRNSLNPQLNQEYVVEVTDLLRELILAAFEPGIEEHKLHLLIQLVLLELPVAKDVATFLPMPLDLRARKVAENALSDKKCLKTFDELCIDANCSNRTMSRIFLEDTRLNFRAWRQRARIMNALQSLQFNQKSIKQISFDLGFSSSAAFAHAFKEVTGKSPTAYKS